MVRFQCIHCGGRIVVQDHHMDRLARCPECGGVTHPLAGHLVANNEAEKLAASKNADGGGKQKGDLAPDLVACGNCGGPIGKLQKPLEWDGHPVCLACHRELSLEKSRSENPPQTATVLAKRSNDVPAEFDSTSHSARAPTVITGLGSRGAFEFTIAFWGACLGLCATAIAIFLIVVILRSLSVLIIWAAAIIALIAVYYWVRRGILALRFPRKVRHVRAIVRD